MCQAAPADVRSLPQSNASEVRADGGSAMESALALHGEENRLIEERRATRYEFG